METLRQERINKASMGSKWSRRTLLLLATTSWRKSRWKRSQRSRNPGISLAYSPQRERI
jgi:hypothetical protein